MKESVVVQWMLSHGGTALMIDNIGSSAYLHDGILFRTGYMAGLVVKYDLLVHQHQSVNPVRRINQPLTPIKRVLEKCSRCKYHIIRGCVVAVFLTFCLFVFPSFRLSVFLTF